MSKSSPVPGGGITGRVTEITKNATGAVTATECLGTLINNRGQGAIATLTLPPAEEGLSCKVIVATIGYALHIKPYTGDKVYLNGTALDDGDKVSLATPAVGNLAHFFTFQTGASSWDWSCNPVVGTWTDGGA